jgi:hypothetical protein
VSSGTVSAAVRRAAKRVQRRTIAFKATLSTATGDITPGLSADVAGQPGYSWVVMPTGGVIKAKNGRAPSATGLRVWVGYEPHNPTLLRVLDVDESYVGVTGGGTGGGTGSAIGAHAAQHAWQSWDTLYSQARQLMPLRLAPAGGFTVAVEPSPVAVAAGYALSSSATLDLTSLRPVVGALYALVFLTAAGVLTARAGANVGAFASLHYTNIPPPGAGERALAAVALYQGQAAISDAHDVIDLRFSNFQSSTQVALPWVNVKTQGGAVGDGAASDDAAFTAAIALLHATGGGTLYLPPGSYKTAGGFTAADPIMVRGDGGNGKHGDVLLPDAPTRWLCTSATADLLTFNSPGCSIRDVALINTNAGVPSAGAGLIVKGRDDNMHIDRVSVSGFFNCVDIQTAFLWHMDGCLILNPVSYGLKIADSYNTDWGDFTISNCQFHPGSRNGATAIRHESAGGMYMVNCKLDGWRATAMGTVYRFAHAYDLSPTSSTSSSIVQISNCSIENISGDAITANVTGGANWKFIILDGLQFGLYTITGHAIKLAAGALGDLKDITITGCTFFTDYGSAVSAIDLTNIQSVRLANNLNDGFPAKLTQSGCADVIDLDAATGPDIYAPMVTGDTPGPVALATGDGQFIMARIA